MSEGRSPERLCGAAACGRDPMAKPVECGMNAKRTERTADPGQPRGALGGDRVRRRNAGGRARRIGRALDASVALIDRSSNVLAVAAASPDEERKLLAGGAAWRPWSYGSPTPPSASCAGGRGARTSLTPRCCGWSRRCSGSSWSARARRSGRPRRRRGTSCAPCSAASSPTARTSRPARRSSGRTSRDGTGVLIARAHPHVAQSGEWRARVLTIAQRAIRAVSSGASPVRGTRKARGPRSSRSCRRATTSGLPVPRRGSRTSSRRD